MPTHKKIIIMLDKELIRINAEEKLIEMLAPTVSDEISKHFNDISDGYIETFSDSLIKSLNLLSDNVFSSILLLWLHNRNPAINENDDEYIELVLDNVLEII